MDLLKPLCEGCNRKMSLAWITYDKGVPERAAWRCDRCRSIVSDDISEFVMKKRKQPSRRST